MKATGRWWVVALAAIVGLALVGCSDFNTNGDEIQGAISGTGGNSTDGGGSTGGDSADETGTDGLEYTLNDAKTAYSVSAGTVTSGDVVIPSTHEGLPVTEVLSSGFRDLTGITSVQLPSSIVTIGSLAFSGCAFTQITIPSSVTTIGNYAFQASGLTSIDLASVTTLESAVFESCSSLKTADAGSVTSMGGACFAFCTTLDSVTLSDNLTTIQNYSFAGCESLQSIELPDNLTTINLYVFESSGLTSVTIPAGVTKIGSEAFTYCNSLTSVTVLATTPPTIDDSTFTEVYATFYVPSSVVDVYKAADYWESLTIEAIIS